MAGVLIVNMTDKKNVPNTDRADMTDIMNKTNVTGIGRVNRYFI